MGYGLENSHLAESVHSPEPWTRLPFWAASSDNTDVVPVRVDYKNGRKVELTTMETPQVNKSRARDSGCQRFGLMWQNQDGSYIKSVNGTIRRVGLSGQAIDPTAPTLCPHSVLGQPCYGLAMDSYEYSPQSQGLTAVVNRGLLEVLPRPVQGPAWRLPYMGDDWQRSELSSIPNPYKPDPTDPPEKGKRRRSVPVVPTPPRASAGRASGLVAATATEAVPDLEVEPDKATISLEGNDSDFDEYYAGTALEMSQARRDML